MRFLLALVLTLGLALPASSSEYCLGEWTEEADTYCSKLMMYAKTLTLDRNVYRPKEEVIAEIPQATITFLIPSNLAHNYIEFIWQEEPGHFSVDEPGYLLMGGCIDNFEDLQRLGIEDAMRALEDLMPVSQI